MILKSFDFKFYLTLNIARVCVLSVGVQRRVRASDWSCRACRGGETASHQSHWQHHLLGVHLHDSRSLWAGQAHLHGPDDIPRQYHHFMSFFAI